MKKLILTLLSSLLLVIGNPFYIHSQTKAFPTAEGFGCMATGGRGGKVVEVTNTLDDATGATVGSFRWALKQYTSDPITIVFKVSGVIKLVADIRSTRTTGLTIAGQTAPGDGICIRGHKVNLGGSKNVIIRHIRFRIGLADDGSFVAGGSLGFENGSNWIIDHCTFGWSGEENTTIYDNTLTTMQWCILHEGLYASGHSKGARSYACQWGGQSATYHHNLLAHNYNRSPRFNGARSNDMNVLIDYVNNVNYNWGKVNSCYGSDIENTSNRTNFVNNYYKPGPARTGTNSSYFTQSSVSSNQGYQVAQWYMSGNYMEGSANTAKNTNNYLGLDMSAYSSTVKADSSLFISPTPFAVTYPVITETAQDAYNSVLANAGAFPRDTTDRRIIYEVKTGTASGKGTSEQYLNSDGVTYTTNSFFNVAKGIIDNPVLAFGDSIAYPNYKTYNTITDNDHDGIDDAWETQNGLNPADASDGNLFVESGYTVLEVYLNSLVGETIPLNIITSANTLKKNDNTHYTLTENSLVFSENTQPITSVRIFTLSGQSVLTQTAKEITRVDFSTLETGVYLAKIQFADNKVSNLKLIKR